MKKFCIMIQAREDYDYFENFKSQDSDVFVLTFKEEIRKENYFFLPNSTWSQGRNYLLKNCYDEKYEYFIFLDDDVRILNKNKECGISTFKDLLMKHKPCIGFPEYFWHLGKGGGRFGIRKQENKFNRPIRFDQCCVAISSKAIKTILPYEEEFDSKNWWVSGEIMNFKVEVIFSESVLQFNEVVSINLLSEEYPKEGKVEIFNDIKKNFFMKQSLKDYDVYSYPVDRRIESTKDFKKTENIDFEEKKISLYFKEGSTILCKNKDFWRNL